jgi:hypothetical protein
MTKWVKLRLKRDTNQNLKQTISFNVEYMEPFKFKITFMMFTNTLQYDRVS